MMKNMLTLILSVILLNSASAQKAKLSPQSTLYMMHAQKLGLKVHQDGYVYKTVNNTKYMSTMIKVGTISEASLTAIGAHIGTKAGNIWTVQVPIQNLEAFINIDGIEYIQFDEPVFSNMDTARVTTRVDSVHSGINLPMPYSGKDVVVGIIDAGFDYSQVNLFDTLGTTYRVKKIWEQKNPGTPPLSYFYGNELTTPANMFAAQTDAPNFSHGAHVQGIAAGSGFGGDVTHAKFRGMAYESDLVLVGITPSPDQWTSAGLSDIVDGMSYIFNYASVNGKPAVANLSWGCTTGPHDGTSLFSQACDNLTGPGKIFVCSAGNTGQDLVHFNKTFTASDNLVRTTVNVPLVVTEKRAWVDAWGEVGNGFCLEAALYDQQTQLHTINAHCTEDSAYGAYDYYMIGQNNDTCFISIVIDSASYNSEPRIFLDIYNKTNNMIVLTLTATSGTVNMWTGYVKDKSGYYGSFTTYPGIPNMAPGNTNITISDISSANSAISVGAYTSKNIFTNISGNPVSYVGYAVKGNIAPFSSKGPTVDGRTKPDITGPGLVLGSSVSSYDTNFANVTGPDYGAVVSSYFKPQNGRTYQYAMLMGTSMSSPAVAGIVALMLQVDPTLDPAAAMDIIKTTAILDNYTGAIPSQGNNTWGWGKINAYQAIKKILEGTGIKTVSSTGESLPCILYPNPSKGNYNIDYNTDKNETLQIEVFNITGAKIISRDWKVNTGSNSTTINMQQVPKGVYFTKLTSKTGSVTVKMTIE
jgi:minor extracellular serine protease Vpr